MAGPVGLLLLSNDGAIRWANKEAAHLFGYSCEELCLMVLPLQPDDGSAFGPVARAFQEVVEGLAAEREGSARFRNKSQKRIAVNWKLWRVVAAEERPQVLLSVWEGMRLSELGPTRYAFEENFETAEEAIFRCSLDGSRFEVNQALASLMGYRNIEALRGPSGTVLERMFVRP